ncbi:hypothetical protein VT84_09135 [Gemmata sp. SH-PL17]|uniref:hypothetical protein n=1 Tax=Gemmata sp. SH-PL17 TaxID=1630693 RepID=UPI00078B9328|nr:hypothetical protein [Gemmata sp. SH-PL17]AMV24546.1 hypothetical protein VT84_09135 [Gemmata sp. SH-PL17]
MAKKTSPPTALLELVWANCQSETSHSWERLNTAMRKALALTIGAGFAFTKTDFEGLAKFRHSYWIGADGEWVYSMAVAEGNYSAAAAFEEYMGRPPIIADKVSPAERHDSYAHLSGDRTSERLHVGCSFEWRGERVKVTSFNDKGAAIACSYHPAEGNGEYERKVKRRYAITRELVILDRAERKQRDAITKDLIANKNDKIDYAKAFGVKTMSELRAIPFARFVKIAERLKKQAA